MGDFRIIIDCVGGHGQDRSKKDGEVVDFNTDGQGSPEALAVELIEKLKQSGCSVDAARIVHWPLDNYGGPEQNGRRQYLADCLLTGKRTGSF